MPELRLVEHGRVEVPVLGWRGPASEAAVEPAALARPVMVAVDDKEHDAEFLRVPAAVSDEPLGVRPPAEIAHLHQEAKAQIGGFTSSMTTEPTQIDPEETPNPVSRTNFSMRR